MSEIKISSIFQPTVLFALALMAAILAMILPMPSWLLDIGLTISFTLAILIFTVTLFVERPLDFSSFPTILLSSLMLRLSLNISSTRLIISEGHTGTGAAGSIIEGFAAFIMGGSVLQGAVIFCVLMIVNFMVITKGAGRMAEVGARFALDGMPGRQLAIDSDMSAGAIDAIEAKHRRERELAETSFFGSLDGVSKFVRGDAIAGLLITCLTITVGLANGIFVHNLPFDEAIATYTILTIGDGLVAQIPAVIISVAAALLLTRDNQKNNQNIFSQLGKYPAALATVALVLVVFALFPGLPFLPFMLASLSLSTLAWRGFRKPAITKQPAEAPQLVHKAQRPIGDILDLDEIHVEVGTDLVTLILDPGTGLDARIASIRNHIATSYGIILPEIRLTDSAILPSGTYRILFQGVEAARDVLKTDHVLVLLQSEAGSAPPSGEDVREPVYGAPARWIATSQQETAVLSGMTVVSPAEVLATHLLELVKDNLARLLTLRGLRRILEEFTSLSDSIRSEANRRMLDELIPDKVQPDMLLAVMRLLLEERVSVRNLPLILEAIAEMRNSNGHAELVCEHVRRRIGFQIVANLRRSDGTIPLIQLAPEWDQVFSTYQIDTDRGLPEVALPPDDFQRLSSSLAQQLSKAGEHGINPALITSPLRRRFLRSITAAKKIPIPVLSYDEIGHDARPSLIGVIAA